MLKKIEENIYYFEPEEPGDRPALGYVKGTRMSLAVDAGNSPAHVRDFYAALEAEGLPLPSLTVLTHWHWDHTYGMCAVNGQTVAAEETKEYLARMMKWEWTDEAMKRRLETGEEVAFCDEHMREAYADPETIRVVLPDIAFSGKMEIELGGITVKLFETPSPHEHSNVLVEAGNVLFVGDAPYEDFYLLGRHYSHARVEAFIGVLNGFGTYWCCAGHQPVQPLKETISDLWDAPSESFID